MSRRARLRIVPALFLAAGLALAGCGDDGPSGPGTLEGRVTGPEALGAVVLIVDGSGIDAVSGAGGTRAFVGPASGTTRRVILVGGASGELTFDLEVQDVASKPSVTVSAATNTSNVSLAALDEVDVGLSAR